ncbi:hypothetical protein P7228_09510 [Altererythrobacter arenosus]|uniref:Uncharacterized protein n=1 Tax=Altererythrobacter arenosus TaxID=3032592 RepID=A0ABY8FQ50_9SPHN|nr:hypothetical protein [Altererythrobacter sp. CAU 1644]WFL76235.1 hypothetical protein P7228_09510 [Altererythrobacter sp. CAU 1644]
MTHLAEATAERLQQSAFSVIADREIFRAMVRVYEAGETKYLRGNEPTLSMLESTKAALSAENIISRDRDYGRFWRLNIVPDNDVAEIVTHVDPAIYVSHLSAMVIYNLTTRRPKPLYLTKASGAAWKEIQEKVQEAEFYPKYETQPLSNVHHPKRVRGRLLETLTTKKYGDHLTTRNSRQRVATIGQTFLDMVEKPSLCGGMTHVLEVYEEYAETHLSEIVRTVEQSGSQIAKVRAGYILEEYISLSHETVSGWTQFAQRGSSRVLDPEKPFEPQFSERWMMSINV